MVLDLIKGRAVCTFILFNKNNYVIAKFKAVDSTGNMPDGNFTIKGSNIFVKVGEEYSITATLLKEDKYAHTYEAMRVATEVDLSPENKKSVKLFLQNILSESRAEAMMETLEDPIKALEDKDYDALCSVSGIGQATAEKLIDLYIAQKDYSLAYIELNEYKLTAGAIIKICEHFGTPEVAVGRVKENPYCLTEVGGYGFTKADVVFLNDSTNSPTDPRRVEAYIEYMFDKENEEGNTWVTPTEFLTKLKTFIPDADLEHAVRYVMESPKFVVMKIEDEKRITTAKMYAVENAIVENLHRLMSTPTTMKLDGYEKSIVATEKMNGWEYNAEQRKAIENMVTQNVYMLQGLAGTGKSTTVKAFLNAVEALGYEYKQCALSGKASNNLTIVTGKQGHTIHSLLGAGREGYTYDEKSPLLTNVVVLDELSMVNANIFLDLLKAIPTGSKLIMLGDFGQLEAIGVGVMGALIKSKVVPMTLLKEIHRQSKESAIITHSISVRNGLKPDELKLEAGLNKTYGTRQDLEYVIVDSESESDIFTKTMIKFKEALSKYSIEDIQIICSTKTTGVVSTYDLNKNAQLIYNPFKTGQDEVVLGMKDYEYALRIGDKVINMKNDRNTTSPDKKSRPIFNGNTGIIKNITYDNKEPMLLINFDGIGDVMVGGGALKNIQLGYAITTHKSQGSTIKCVLFALPYHYLLNTRQMVYTGMTRASDYQALITSPKSFKRAIKASNVKKKKTNLADLLIDKFTEAPVA